MAKGLSRETLGRAALQIVDAEGLSALSMRRLARALEVDPMAAYRHLRDKDELLDAVVDAVLAEITLPQGEGIETLRSGAHAALSTMARHPNAAPLLSARQWLSPHGLAVIEWGMQRLDEAGVDPARSVRLMNATGLFLTGLAQAMTGADHTDPRSALTPERHPATLAALTGGHGLTGYPELLDFWLDTSLADGRLGRGHTGD